MGKHTGAAGQGRCDGTDWPLIWWHRLSRQGDLSRRPLCPSWGGLAVQREDITLGENKEIVDLFLFRRNQSIEQFASPKACKIGKQWILDTMGIFRFYEKVVILKSLPFYIEAGWSAEYFSMPVVCLRKDVVGCDLHAVPLVVLFVMLKLQILEKGQDPTPDLRQMPECWKSTNQTVITPQSRLGIV